MRGTPVLLLGGLTSAQGKGETVRFQDYPGIGNLLLKVAKAKGYCEQNGIKCESVLIQSGALGAQALAAGSVDVALLPIASLDDPLTAAQVLALRREGRDWFRERLLPDGLTRLQLAVVGLRRQGGRLAVLDGRLRGRSWGRQVLRALEPWVNLNRLLPH